MAVHEEICEFDDMAGHVLQHEKTAFIANNSATIKQLQKITLKEHTAKNGNVMTLVGDTIATSVGRIVAPVDERVKKAINIAGKLANLNTNIAKRTRVAAAAVIPTAVYGTQWVKARW